MSDLWNEGRVLGLTAYEQYVKQFLSVNPNGTPADEQEWLSSSLATGSSIVVKLPSATGTLISTNNHYLLNVPLPTDSNLRAANTIYGAFFDGDIESAGLVYPNFGIRTSSYGQLVANSYSSHPTGAKDVAGTEALPSEFNAVAESARQNRMAEYNKIIDGIILQPGTWTDATMYSTFTPDLTKPPVLRLELSAQISVGAEPFVILTGFTDAGVLTGVSGIDGVVPPTDHPYDGDFLGPALFPWAAKVIFTPVPSASSSNMTVSSGTVSYYVMDSVLTPGTARFIDIDISGTHYKSIAIVDSTGTQYVVGTDPANKISVRNSAYTDSNDDLKWSILLQALSENKAIDILGTDLKAAKTGLPNGYITFKKGNANEVRLYVSKTNPGTDDGHIPDGSIGIGWTT